MRAEPRRRTHTIGSKWLRHGSTVPTYEAGDDGVEKIGNNEIKIDKDNISVRDNERSIWE